MTTRPRIHALLPAALLLALGCQTAARKPAGFAQAVRERPSVTIVVTDSGLGGLSVAATLAARLSASGIAKSVRIVFVNALLDDAIGYNDLKLERDKLCVFDAALAAMESRYKPDLILIACNTLSVLYERTNHAKAHGTETVDIVGMGADLIDRTLREIPGGTAIIFGTRTTIESGAYPRLLQEKGVPADRIVGEACHRLAGSIERGAESDETAAYIQTFVTEAVGRLPESSGPIVASLNCTHFGYAADLWKKTFTGLGYPGVTIVDPNPLMADLVLTEGGPKRYPSTAVTVEVISKVKIGADVQTSLGRLLRMVSPTTADALVSYTYDPVLFDVTIDPSAVIR